MATLTDGQIAKLARDAGFSTAESAVAVAVALAESGGDPNAKHTNSNGSTDTGLWQINSIHTEFKGQNLTDPATNAKAARVVFEKQGWKAWTVFTSGAYKQYRDRGEKAVPDAINLPAGPVDDFGKAISSAADVITNPLEVFRVFTDFLSKRENWYRVIQVGLGVVVIVVGVAIFASDSSTGRAVTGAVTKGVIK